MGRVLVFSLVLSACYSPRTYRITPSPQRHYGSPLSEVADGAGEALASASAIRIVSQGGCQAEQSSNCTLLIEEIETRLRHAGLEIDDSASLTLHIDLQPRPFRTQRIAVSHGKKKKRLSRCTDDFREAYETRALLTRGDKRLWTFSDAAIPPAHESRNMSLADDATPSGLLVTGGLLVTPFLLAALLDSGEEKRSDEDERDRDPGISTMSAGVFLLGMTVAGLVVLVSATAIDDPEDKDTPERAACSPWFEQNFELHARRLVNPLVDLRNGAHR